MAWLHVIFGLLLFIVFAVTGRYMRVDFPDKDLINPELRLLMRSRHIYILFSALIHLAMGVYIQLRSTQLLRTLQFAGSGVLVIASVLLVWAWCVETYQLQTFSDISRQGIYLSLFGVGLHLIAGVRVGSPHVSKGSSQQD
jgi:hypothetical protein